MMTKKRKRKLPFFLFFCKTSHVVRANSVADTLKPSSPWQAVRLIFDISWWRDALRLTLQFAPFCIAPGVFMALSGTVTNTAAVAFAEPLRSNPVELTHLLMAMGVLMLGLLLGLAFIVIGFGGWLFRLAAFSLALIQAPSIDHLSGLASDARKAVFKAAIAEIEPKKVHIGAVLFWATLYMLLPFFMLIGCTVVKIISMPSIMGASAVNIPAWAEIACSIIAVPNFIFLLIFSVVALVVAACSPLPPRPAAGLSFKLSCRYILPLSVISVAFTLLSCAIGAPNDLRQVMDPQAVMGEHNPFVRVGNHVWQSLISILLFPLSFTPFCDVLRLPLRDDLVQGKTIEGDGATEIA